MNNQRLPVCAYWEGMGAPVSRASLGKIVTGVTVSKLVVGLYLRRLFVLAPTISRVIF